jgi:hypothetical protein
MKKWVLVDSTVCALAQFGPANVSWELLIYLGLSAIIVIKEGSVSWRRIRYSG